MTTAGEVVELARGDRPLPTELHLASAQPPWPLVVFAHGWMGHPDRFTRLFGRWTEAGFAVAGPTFPYTNAGSSGREFDDVANQPADVRFVLDRLLEDGRFDAARVAVAGFSLGGMTALATVYGRERPEERAAAVVAISARLPWFAECELRACPLLVVHGRHDDVVEYEHGVEVYRRAPPPKALLTSELPGHEHYVQDEHTTDADALVADVTAAFLDATLNGSAPRPLVDPALGRLETEGIW